MENINTEKKIQKKSNLILKKANMLLEEEKPQLQKSGLKKVLEKFM